MRWIWFWLYSTMLIASPPIVFVHLGPKLPTYLPTAIAQAKLFNPESPIYLAASQVALLQCRELQGVIRVPYEMLTQSTQHETFISQARLYRVYREPFWRYSLERFFVLHELMQEHQLTDVIHLENDVMLYRDMNELIPTLHAHYAGQLGITLDNDTRCIAGLVYVARPEPLAKFLDLVISRLRTQSYDMFYLAQFHAVEPWSAQQLPILPQSYAMSYELVNPQGQRAKDSTPYWRYAKEFGGIFDAAAIGQYLGGIDPIHGKDTVGFVNECSVFNPSRVEITWQRDTQGRLVPYLRCGNESCRINNLHIHSKNLAAFSSQRSKP